MDLDLTHWRATALTLESALDGVVLGMSQATRLVTIALFARGHVLLEGDVGVGKTTLLRAVARALGGAYQRVEGTADLMPADLIYYTQLADDGRPRVLPGSLIAHGSELATFFFNEINRARPQVHALLLRVMAERSVSAFNREIALPYLQVFADRNRVEREETFELPAASRDRFFMEIAIEAPRDRALLRSLMFDTRFHDVDALISAVPRGLIDVTQLDGVSRKLQSEVQASPRLEAYGVDLWLATRDPAQYGVRLPELDLPDCSELVFAGASPRGAAMLVRAARVQAWLEGRDSVLPEDVRSVFDATIAHRICLQPMYEPERARYLRPFVSEVLRRVSSP